MIMIEGIEVERIQWVAFVSQATLSSLLRTPLSSLVSGKRSAKPTPACLQPATFPHNNSRNLPSFLLWRRQQEQNTKSGLEGRVQLRRERGQLHPSQPARLLRPRLTTPNPVSQVSNRSIEMNQLKAPFNFAVFPDVLFLPPVFPASRGGGGGGL